VERVREMADQRTEQELRRGTGPADTITVAGHDLVKELIGRHTF